MTDANTLMPTDADIIALADKTRTGEPGREGYILPISFARAVLAKWGTPAPASQPVAAPAGMEPVAWVEVHPGLDGWFLAYSFNPDAKTEPLYNPDDVAFPVQRSADGTDVPPELASTARPTSIAAVEVAAPSAPRKQESTMALHEQIEALARKHGATSYRNRADTQHPAYGFTPSGLLNLVADVRKQDTALIRQMLDALECAGAYTALIDDISLTAIREAHKAASARLEGNP